MEFQRFISAIKKPRSACTHQFLCFTDQLLFFFPGEAPLSFTAELDELAFFLGHGVSWLWDLS